MKDAGKKRTVASRQRNAVRRALEKAVERLECYEMPLTGTEAAAVVRALIEAKADR